MSLLNQPDGGVAVVNSTPANVSDALESPAVLVQIVPQSKINRPRVGTVMKSHCVTDRGLQVSLTKKKRKRLSSRLIQLLPRF